MRLFSGKRRIPVLIATGILVVAIPFIVISLLDSQHVFADWFNQSWKYRESITFTNSGAAVTNEKVLVQFDTATPIAASKMQTSCQDVRFTDAQGSVLQYYINVSGGAGIGCNDASSDFYVLMPAIVSGSNLIYIYYGNSAAAAGTVSANFSQATFSPGAGPTIGSEQVGPGPVAWWHFDEGYGTTAHDSTAFGHTLTLTSTAWATESASLSNRKQYLQFNGATSQASAASASDLNFGTGSFTVSGWFHHSPAIPATDTIIAKYSTAGWKVYMNSSGFICFDIDADATFGGANYDSACSGSAQGSYADSKWHQFEAVKNGTTSITLYIDGNQVAQDASIAATGTLSSTATLYIGVDTTTNWWHGWLDEIVIYPYARSSSQVMTDLLGLHSGTVFGASASDPLTSGLAGWWKMDESSWINDCSTPTSVDSSGTGNNAISCPQGGGPTGNVAGMFGNAGLFSGSTQYLDASGSASLANIFSGGGTVSAWIYLNGYGGGTGGYGRIIDKNQSGTAVYVCGPSSTNCNLNSFQLYFDANTPGRWSAPTNSISLGQWYMVTVTYDSNNTSIDPIMYINGRQVAVTRNTSPTSLWGDAPGDLIIGNKLSQDRGFNGRIDDLRMYKRILSPADVRQLYNWAAGPVGWWKMDEGSWTNNCSTTTVFDSSGTGNNLVSCPSGTGPAGGAPGKYGNAGEFDGANQYLLSASTALTDIANQNLTISAWIYKAPSSSTDVIVAKKKTTLTADPGYYMYVNSTGKLSVIISDGVSDFQIQYPTTLTYNTWTHVEAVIDKKSATASDIYINGARVFGTQTGTLSSVGSLTNTRKLAVAGQDAGNTLYEGKIDDLKVYDYARTPAQVVEDMNGTHPAPGSPVGSPALYWKFDEGQGTTANNSGYMGSAANGTISGGTWYPGGKSGNAVALSSSANYVSAGTQSFPDSATGMSVSLWVKPTTLAVNNALVSRSNFSTQNSFAIVTDAASSGDIRVHIPTTLSDTGTYFTTSGLGLSNLTWSHIEVVYNSSESASTRVRVYKNGREISGTVTGTLPDKMTTGSTAALKVGASDSGSFTALNAVYDEVKIYPYPLTYDQVLVDYNGRASEALGALTTDTDAVSATNAAVRMYCVPGDTASCASPLGWWKFDENTGSSVTDASGNNLTGTWQGGLGSQWAPGKIGSAGNFDGSTNYVTFGNPPPLQLTTTPITVSAWIYLTEGSALHDIVSKKGNTGNFGWRFWTNNNKLNMEVSGDGTALTSQISTTTLNTYTWYYVTGVYIPSTSLTLYVNGVPDAQTATSIPASVFNSTADFVIGANSAGSTNFMSGRIDNVTVYNYARTPAQIAWEFNRGAPVSWWKFDECQGNVAHDSGQSGSGASNGNNLTINIDGAGTQTSPGTCGSGASTEAWNNGSTGKLNASLNLDGSDDHATSSAYSPLATAGLTTQKASWGGWFFPTAVNSDTWIEKATEFELITNSTGQIQCAIYYTGAFHFGVAVSITQNTWDHIYCVFDGSNIYTYLNGTLVDTKAETHSITASSSVLFIGQNDAGARRLGARMDDIRIFNYPLTAYQVRLLYNGGAGVRFGPLTGSP